MGLAFTPTRLNDLVVDVSLSGVAQGDILYRGASKWNNLAPGNSGDVLTSGGAGADPAWAAPSTAPFADTTSIVKGSVDATKLLRFEVDGFTAGATRVLTPPDSNGTIALATGLAGGQVIYGGTAASNNLQLWSTSNATQGSIGVSTSSPITTFGGMDVSSGGFGLALGADNNANTRTNTTTKIARFVCPHYTNSEEPFGMLIATSTVNSNEVTYGGNSSQVNAATLITFYTGATHTTTDGSERMRINSTGQVGIGGDNSTVLALAAMQAALCLNDAATNSASVHTAFTHRTSGTPAAGYGSELRFYLESTTTEYVDAGGIVNAWTVATHASRSSEFKLYAITNAAARAEVARFDGGGGATPTAGNTGMMLWDVDNATLERVTVGVADSGGTGYKVLRIPN